MSKSDETVFPLNVNNRVAMNGDCLSVGPLKGGLTKRELFAAKIFAQTIDLTAPQQYPDWAERAVKAADALINALRAGVKDE